MSQAYHQPASNVYGIKYAPGFFFDRGISVFGKHVEAVVQRASQDAISPAFARMSEQRAFAAAMGDDMETSNVGFADPFADGAVEGVDGGDEIIMSDY